MRERYFNRRVALVKRLKDKLIYLVLFLVIFLTLFYKFMAPEPFRRVVYGNFLYGKLIAPLIRVLRDPVNHNLKLKAPSYKITTNPSDWSRITTPEPGFDKMNPILRPRSGQEWISGYLDETAGRRQIKLKLRGSSYFHYAGPKKSVWIKVGGDKKIRGWKYASLINIKREDYFIDNFVYDTSSEIGLLSPYHRNIHLYINNKYTGFYHEIEQFDKFFLEKKKLPVDDIYFLDLSGDRKGFFNSIYWRQKSRPAGVKKGDRKKLDNLLSDLKEFKTDSINIEQSLKHIILFELVGSRHIDYIHNHRIYYNPLFKKFEPIAWDVGVILKDSSYDVPNNPIYAAVVYNHETRLRKYQLQKEILEKEITPSYIEKYFLNIIESYYNDILMDKHMGHYYSISPESWVESTKNLIERVKRRRLEMIEIANENNIINASIIKNKLKLKINSNHVVELQSILINGNEKIKSPELFYSDFKRNSEFLNENLSDDLRRRPILRIEKNKLFESVSEIKSYEVRIKQLVTGEVTTIRGGDDNI